MKTTAAFIFITLPWLNPFAIGPTPNVVPLLFSLACAGVLILIFLTISDPISGQSLVRTTATAWLVAAILSSVIGLFQYFDATAIFGQWVNKPLSGFIYANLRQRNLFATLTNIGMAALLWFAAHGRSGPVMVRTTTVNIEFDGRMLLTMLAAALLSFGNAASSSRIGMVELAMLIIMATIWYYVAGGHANTVRVLSTAVLTYGMAAITLPLMAGLDPNASGILARFHGDVPHCFSRLTLWSNVLHLIAEKPWLGWGWGELDYAHFMAQYEGERFCEILDDAHNLPLNLAVQLGIPLSLLVCGTGVWLAIRAKPWRETDATRRLAWTVIAVIMLHSLVEFPLRYGPFQIAFCLSLWLLLHSHIRNKYKKILPLIKTTNALVAILLIAYTGYAMQDYERISQIYKPEDERTPDLQDDTLAKISDTRLFVDQVKFAELLLTTLTSTNAKKIHALALDLLHYSPEPRVIEVVIESARLLDLQDEVVFYKLRYKAVYPYQYTDYAIRITDAAKIAH